MEGKAEDLATSMCAELSSSCFPPPFFPFLLLSPLHLTSSSPPSRLNRQASTSPTDDTVATHTGRDQPARIWRQPLCRRRRARGGVRRLLLDHARVVVGHGPLGQRAEVHDHRRVSRERRAQRRAALQAVSSGRGKFGNFPSLLFCSFPHQKKKEF